MLIITVTPSGRHYRVPSYQGESESQGGRATCWVSLSKCGADSSAFRLQARPAPQSPCSQALMPAGVMGPYSWVSWKQKGEW